jgi:hypothetical protein
LCWKVFWGKLIKIIFIELFSWWYSKSMYHPQTSNFIFTLENRRRALKKMLPHHSLHDHRICVKYLNCCSKFCFLSSGVKLWFISKLIWFQWNCLNYVNTLPVWKWLSWSWSYGSWIYNYLYAISAYNHSRCEFEYRSGEKLCK